MKRSIPSLLILLATLSSSGCLVIEKKTVVMIVPPESNEIHLYYVFEGISEVQYAHNERPTLRQLQLDLDDLKKEDFSFFLPSGPEENGPVRSRLLKHCRTEKLRFFIDPERKRPLCADRKKTILNRAEFAKILNEHVSGEFTEDFFRLDEKEIQKGIKKVSDALKQSRKEDADDLGRDPLLKTAGGLMEIAENFDLASIKQLKAAVKKGFRWIRIEPDTVRLVLPATRECAKRIAADPKSKDQLKEMRTFVEPIDLEPCDVTAQ